MDEQDVGQEPGTDDRTLIEQVLRGELDRFAELVDRYRRHVVAIVTRHVPADRVPEVAHDVFVRAYTGLAGFSGAVPFEHWLSGIAVRTCYDFWRMFRRGAIPVSALTDDHRRWIDGALAAESEAEFRRQVRQREAAELLDWALSRLPAEDRLVVTLVHLEGRSVREAAELLGWSVVNVKVRAYRARKALRKTLTGLF